MSLLLLFAGATNGQVVVSFPTIVRATTDKLTPTKTTDRLTSQKTMSLLED